MEFSQLYDHAKKKLNPREVSPFISAGSVAAAILTNNGNVYTGVSIDTACTLGTCAERNAVANMITNGENQIVKLVCVFDDGSIVSPCGACREYLMQLHPENHRMQILQDLPAGQTTTLKELLPEWWGVRRFAESTNTNQSSGAPVTPAYHNRSKKHE